MSRENWEHSGSFLAYNTQHIEFADCIMEVTSLWGLTLITLYTRIFTDRNVSILLHNSLFQS